MTTEINSEKLGRLGVDKDLLLTFPEGIPGFQQIHEYALIPHSVESPFSWLQAFNDPGLSFLVTDPLIFMTNYQPTYLPEEIKILESEDPSALITLVMVSIPHNDPSKTTINLMAPLCINPKNRKGRQVILTQFNYSHQTPLFVTSPESTPETPDKH